VGGKAAPRGNQQQLDALALADVMSGDRGTRSPRGPAPTAPAQLAPSAATPAAPAAAADPAIPSPRPMSETRTSSQSGPSGPSAPSGPSGRSAPAPAGAIVLSRAEVDRALADFSRLTAAIHGSFSDAGVAIDSVGEGTIFARAGLAAGDTITSIDGARLRSLDDAANLYARASTASSLTAQLVRGGKPVTLHVVIQ
jgi:membrane-associated protease RseP (regulator of RpoE activity)